MKTTTKQIAKMESLIKKLKSAQVIADSLELTVGNGGEVGGLIGSLADELEIKLDSIKANNFVNSLAIVQ